MQPLVAKTKNGVPRWASRIIPPHKLMKVDRGPSLVAGKKTGAGSQLAATLGKHTLFGEGGSSDLLLKKKIRRKVPNIGFYSIRY